MQTDRRRLPTSPCPIGRRNRCRPASATRSVYPFAGPRKGKQYGNFHVFHYVISIDGNKVVKSVRLPSSTAVKVLAATLSRDG